MPTNNTNNVFMCNCCYLKMIWAGKQDYESLSELKIELGILVGRVFNHNCDGYNCVEKSC